MFFNGWEGIGRTVLAGTLAYVALIILLRISGKRTLSKMSAFDLVVTVALGSTLSTILLSRDVALAEGVAAFAVLIVLQFVIAWFSARSPTLERWVKSEPSLLVRRGEFLRQSMRRERVTEAEIRAAVRAQGVADLASVDAVVLETDGSLTVVRHSGDAERPVLTRSGIEHVGQSPPSDPELSGQAQRSRFRWAGSECQRGQHRAWLIACL